MEYQQKRNRETEETEKNEGRKKKHTRKLTFILHVTLFFRAKFKEEF